MSFPYSNNYNLRGGNRNVVGTISAASGYNAFGVAPKAPAPATPAYQTPIKPMEIPGLAAYTPAPTPAYTAPAYTGRSDSAGSLPGIGYGWSSFQRDCNAMGWGAAGK